ncbi:uncharacterized protein LOC144342914 [Saccoglossus kowalevskii]
MTRTTTADEIIELDQLNVPAVSDQNGTSQENELQMSTEETTETRENAQSGDTAVDPTPRQSRPRARRRKRKLTITAYIFILLNLLYISIAVALIVWAVHSATSGGIHHRLTLSYVDIIVAAFMIFFSGFGIAGALQNDPNTLYLPVNFFCSALILFHLLVALGYLDMSGSHLKKSRKLTDTWDYSSYDERAEIQVEFDCCGISRSRRGLPIDPPCDHLPCCNHDSKSSSQEAIILRRPARPKTTPPALTSSPPETTCPKCQTCTVVLGNEISRIIDSHVIVWLVICILEIPGQVLSWMIWLYPLKYHYRDDRGASQVEELRIQ